MSLVLTYLVGGWGLPGLEDTGNVACWDPGKGVKWPTWCLYVTGAPGVCSGPSGGQLPRPHVLVEPCLCPLWVPSQHLALRGPFVVG